MGLSGYKQQFLLLSPEILSTAVAALFRFEGIR